MLKLCWALDGGPYPLGFSDASKDSCRDHGESTKKSLVLKRLKAEIY